MEEGVVAPLGNSLWGRNTTASNSSTVRQRPAATGLTYRRGPSCAQGPCSAGCARAPLGSGRSGWCRPAACPGACPRAPALTAPARTSGRAGRSLERGRRRPGSLRDPAACRGPSLVCLDYLLETNALNKHPSNQTCKNYISPPYCLQLEIITFMSS